MSLYIVIVFRLIRPESKVHNMSVCHLKLTLEMVLIGTKMT
jgi:hypothetical protein